MRVEFCLKFQSLFGKPPLQFYKMFEHIEIFEIPNVWRTVPQAFSLFKILLEGEVLNNYVYLYIPVSAFE